MGRLNSAASMLIRMDFNLLTAVQDKGSAPCTLLKLITRLLLCVRLFADFTVWLEEPSMPL